MSVFAVTIFQQAQCKSNKNFIIVKLQITLFREMVFFSIFANRRYTNACNLRYHISK